MEELSREELIAISVAAIAEETGSAVSDIRVTGFREIQKSPLMQYIEDNNIDYKKYTLEDELR